jgi:hypothetical protein
MKNVPAAVLLMLSLAVIAPVMSQTSSCKVGVKAAPVGFWSWSSGSKVEVYVVREDFIDNELPFLLEPLSTWNAVSESTGSKVKFEYKGTTAEPRYCKNCLTITRGRVFDKSERHLTELRAYSAEGNRIVTWGTIVIDPLLTNPKTLTNAVAHELGHSFGLMDCYNCARNRTVMGKFKDVNVSNEMIGPSACDVAQVKATYLALAAAAKRARQVKPVVVDEGEEPVEDDTPVIVPKP